MIDVKNKVKKTHDFNHKSKKTVYFTDQEEVVKEIIGNNSDILNVKSGGDDYHDGDLPIHFAAKLSMS